MKPHEAFNALQKVANLIGLQGKKVDKYWEDQWLIGELHDELAEAGIGYKIG